MLDAYAAFVDPLVMAPGEIRDETELPAPKAALIAALVEAYQKETYAATRSEIQRRLLLLAQFQPGVGSPILEPAAEMARRIGAMAGGGQRPDAAAIGRAVEADAAKERWALRRPAFLARVETEAADLMANLTAAR